MKTIILHYHLFKNAGTSLDAMFRANFGAGWVTAEFDPAPAGASNTDAVKAFLLDHPEAVVLSSHTAELPAPEIEGLDIRPVLFVRHPLLRIRSAYRFEVNQVADTFGARLAKRTDFAGYVRGWLDQGGPGQVRDFQSHRLAFFEPDSTAPPIERALAAAERLPFVGLVERYEASVARLAEYLRPAFPDFDPVIFHRNVSGEPNMTLDQKIAQIRTELGERLYDELVDANRGDFALHRKVRASYGE